MSADGNDSIRPNMKESRQMFIKGFLKSPNTRLPAMLKDHQNSLILETKFLYSTFPLFEQGYKTPKTSTRNFNPPERERSSSSQKKNISK
jgi:hypothetical protein